MSRALFIYENEVPTVSMMREIFTSSKEEMTIDSVFCSLSNLDNDKISQSDILIFVRSTDSWSVNIAKHARKIGKFIIAYYDDDLLNRPKDRPVISWRRSNVIELLKQSDMVLSPSKRIGRKYAEYTIGNRSAQMHTIVRESELRSHKRGECDYVRIIYAANQAHVVLVDKYIKPVIKELKTLDFRVVFYFFGVHPLFNDCDLPDNVCVEYIPTKSFIQYRQYMDSHDFDIGLAPIFEDEFSKCKYFNKFIEYAIFEIPGIYTCSEPYTEVVKNLYNGVLVKNTYKEWGNALKRLIQDKKLRLQLGENAFNTVKIRFGFKQIITNLLEDIPELYTWFAPSRDHILKKTFKYKYNVLRLEELIFLTIQYAKERGIRGFLKKVKNHFSERKVFHGGTSI